MITKEEKKERRQVKHQLQKQFRRHAVRRTGFFSTEGQLQQMTKTMVDRVYSAYLNGGIDGTRGRTSKRSEETDLLSGGIDNSSSERSGD